MNLHRYGLAIAVASFISAPAFATSWVATQTHAHAVVSRAGEAVDAAEELAPSTDLHIVLSLRLRNEAALDARLARIQQGSSSDLLRAADFRALHAPLAGRVQAVVDYLAAQGFRNVTVAPNNLLVSADGSVAAIESAFHTELHHFEVDGRTVYANTADVQIPAELSDTVLAVHGLQNANVMHTNYYRAELSQEATTKVVPAKVGHNPTDFPHIYNAASLTPASDVTVGIIVEGQLTQTIDDLNTFTASNGLPTVSTELVHAGAASADTSGLEEWNLDSQDIVGTAGAVKELIFYIASAMDNASLIEAINAAVSANQAKVINISLGECELDAKSDGTEAAGDSLFKAAVAQGQTFSVSAGDADSYECGGRALDQSYPAVSPYVVAVGGTTLSTTNTTTWSSETVWYTSSTEGTGGGVSSTESAPSWQTSAGVIAKSKARGVPDVSFDGDPASGALIYVNGRRDAQVGGTSLSSPLFVGLWARLLQNHGGQLAYPASAFYKYFPSHENALLHDVTSGRNGGYSAKSGWDYASGFGSFNVGTLSSFIGSNSGF